MTRQASRKIPVWLLALGGVAATVTYGYLAAKLPVGAPLVIMGLGGLALTLCGVALWRALDPLLRAHAAPPEAVAAPARLRELEREKQAVLKAIREIELDFQMRKIGQADHKEMTQRYRARAMRIIGELDAGEDFRALIEHELKIRLGAIGVAAAGSGCASCGTANDKDAVFCKTCGGKLGGPG